MKKVVCALIVNNGKLLIVQHPPESGHALQWEFPGGKIQEGEDNETALIREVYEELNIEISVENALHPGIYQYPGKEIHLIPYLCRWSSGTLTLFEHHAFLWIKPKEIFNHNMLPADFEMLNRSDNFLQLLQYAQRQPESLKDTEMHRNT
jgi:8-oxo-dGTP diphosphatase